METLNKIINLVTGMIASGCILSILISLFCISKNPEEKDSYIKRIKNVLIFLIIGILLYSIKDIVISYFGTPNFKTY